MQGVIGCRACGGAAGERWPSVIAAFEVFAIFAVAVLIFGLVCKLGISSKRIGSVRVGRGAD